MSLRHGARQLMDMFESDEDEIMRLLELAAARVKFNPDYSIEKIHAAQARLLAIRERRTQELPALLQKAAPSLEKRVDELEKRLEALEQPNVIKLRRAE